MQTTDFLRWRSWLNPRHLRGWVLLLLVLYTLAGFFAVPWLLQRELSGLTQQFIARKSSVGEVRFNPYTLRLQADDLRIFEPAGNSFVSMESLVLNLELSGLLRRALRFSELSVTAPVVQLERYRDGSNNVAQMLADMSANSDAEATEPADGEGALLRLLVDSLQISDGTVALTDSVPVETFRTEFSPVNIRIRDLSTLPEDTGTQAISITTADGAVVRWDGKLQLNPLLAEGQLELQGSPLPVLYSYFEDRLGFSAERSDFRLALNYRIELQNEGLNARINDASLQITDIGLQTTDDNEPLFGLPEFSLAGARLEWPEQRVYVDEIRLQNPELYIRRYTDGTLNLNRLWLPAGAATPATDPGSVAASDSASDSASDANADANTDPAATPDSNAAPVSPWQLEVGDLQIAGMRTVLNDALLQTPAELVIPSLDVALSGLSTAADSMATLAVNIELPEGGAGQLNGKLGISPTPVLDADLELKELALITAQPWVAEAARVQLRDGRLSLSGKLRSDATELLALNASSTLRNLQVSDSLDNEALLGWDALTVDDMRLQLSGAQVEISRIDLEQPFARIIIAEDGSTNFSELATDTEAAEESDESGVTTDRSTPDSNDAGPATSTAGRDFTVRIGATEISGGVVDFTDRALPLPFQALVSDFGGSIGALASDSREPTPLSLEGKVGEFGLATVTGSLRALAPVEQTQMKINFRNIAMPDLSPYSAQFAGRAIRAGKLNLELDYSFSEGVMQGANTMVLSDFELGEKVPNPDALDLPLGLAVALLKDAGGVINLDLAVSGDVNDPQFSAGGIIRKALVNLLTKTVSAPFRLLGALVPGGADKDLAILEFRPGRADIAPPEQEKLQQLAAALAQRPQLMLEVPGAYDGDSDTPALQAAALEAQLADRIAADDDSAKADSAQLLEQTRKVLEQLAAERGIPSGQEIDDFRSNFERPDAESGRSVFDAAAYTAGLRKLLTEAVVIDETALEDLALARRDAVVNALLSRGLATDRVQPSTAAATKLTDDGWIPLELELESSDAAMSDATAE